MNTTINMTFDNTTSGMGILYQSGTPSASVYAVMAAVLTIVLLLGLLENFAVLYTFAKNKTVRTKDNMLIAGLAISDIGQSLFGVPFVVLGAICQQWIFGNFMCQYYGFITTSFGLSQITLLTFIALERYFINIRHVRIFTCSKYKCKCVISSCFLYGFAWATGPLFGWSSYKLEATGISCSVSWEEKTLSSMSFTISLFILGWFLPLLLIAFGYISIARLVLKERIQRKRLQNGSIHRINWEKRVSITIFMMIGAFILSWSPYSVISLWSAFSDTHSIPVWLQVAPALFAKSSIIWNPIIYVCRNGNFRQAVFNSLSCLMLSKTLSENTDELAHTKVTDNEATSLHKDIKTKLTRITPETTKALQKERIYNSKNKNVTSKTKDISKFSTSMISQTNQETTISSRKTNITKIELDCNKTKASPPIRRHYKFSALRKRGLLEKIPEDESDKLFSNHVQRYSFEGTCVLSYIRKYDSSWRQSNKLAEKQTQTKLVPCLEVTLTAEKGLQTDKANWNEVHTRTEKFKHEKNGEELSNKNQAVIQQWIRVSNSFNDLPNISKKRAFDVDPSDKCTLQSSRDTKRQYMRGLKQPQNGKSKNTTAVETTESSGNYQNEDCEYPQNSWHAHKVSKHGQKRKKRYQSNIRELNSDVYNDTVADFNFASEKVEIIHAWRDFDGLQNETDRSKMFVKMLEDQVTRTGK